MQPKVHSMHGLLTRHHTPSAAAFSTLFCEGKIRLLSSSTDNNGQILKAAQQNSKQIIILQSTSLEKKLLVARA